MGKKLFSLLLFILILFVAFLFNAQKSNAESPAFEHSASNDAYVYEASGSNLMGYVWTKTGDLINTLKDLCNVKDVVNNPSPQISGISSTFLLKGGSETVSTLFKTLGPGQEILFASHHPWMFLMTLSFGTLLLSLWFLRLSTGVSPPPLGVHPHLSSPALAGSQVGSLVSLGPPL